MRARHRIVVNNGNWYYDDDHDNVVYDDDDHVKDLQKEDGKTELATVAAMAGGERPEVREEIGVPRTHLATIWRT